MNAGRPLRVLLCGRPDLLSKPGGDTRQILALQRHLDGEAQLSLALRPDLSHVDLVHLFNLSRPIEPALQLAWARRHGCAAVCTPIFQDLREYNRRGRHGAGRWLFAALGRSDGRLETARALVNLWRAGPPALALGAPLLTRAALQRAGAAALALQAHILANSHLLLFNSRLEEQTVNSCLPSARRGGPSALVPVGIDPEELAGVEPGPFLRRYGVEPGFVLAVGRLEDLKNQLGLIRAMEASPLQLVLIGQVNPLHRTYALKVARAAARRPRTLLIQRVERRLLLSAMAGAAVHVLPSWFETAGLVSLEAAVLGCAVVSTDRGYARELLGQEAHYCDPGAPSSIRAAVEAAHARGPSASLRRHILERYTDGRIARRTGELYRQVVG